METERPRWAAFVLIEPEEEEESVGGAMDLGEIFPPPRPLHGKSPGRRRPPSGLCGRRSGEAPSQNWRLQNPEENVLGLSTVGKRECFRKIYNSFFSQNLREQKLRNLKFRQKSSHFDVGYVFEISLRLKRKTLIFSEKIMIYHFLSLK